MGFQTWNATLPLEARAFGMPVYVDSAMIDRQVKSLVQELQREFSATGFPLFIPVLRGGSYFYSDLSLAIQADSKSVVPHGVSYMLARRYGDGTIGNPNVELNWWDVDRNDLRGMTVLLVDDILDEGITAEAIVSGLRQRGAARILSAFACRKVPVKAAFKPDYVLFDVPADVWCAGYGMDWNNAFRNVRMIMGTAGVSPDGHGPFM